MNIPVAQQQFVQATVIGLHARSDRFFDFIHGGQKHHCFYTGAAIGVPGLIGLAAGQRVVMRGRWSRAVLQVFEADAVRVLPGDYGVPMPAFIAAAVAGVVAPARP